MTQNHSIEDRIKRKNNIADCELISRYRKAGLRLHKDILKILCYPEFDTLRHYPSIMFYGDIKKLTDYFSDPKNFEECYKTTDPELAKERSKIACAKLLEMLEFRKAPHRDDYIILNEQEMVDFITSVSPDTSTFISISTATNKNNGITKAFDIYPLTIENLYTNQEFFEDISDCGVRKRALSEIEQMIIKRLSETSLFPNAEKEYFEQPSILSKKDIYMGNGRNENLEEHIISVSQTLDEYANSLNSNPNTTNNYVYNQIKEALNSVNNFLEATKEQIKNKTSQHCLYIPFPESQCFRMYENAISKILKTDFSEQNPIVFNELLLSIKKNLLGFRGYADNMIKKINNDVKDAFEKNEKRISDFSGYISNSHSVSAEKVLEYIKDKRKDGIIDSYEVAGSFSIQKSPIKADDGSGYKVEKVDFSDERFESIFQRQQSAENPDLYTILYRDRKKNEVYVADYDYKKHSLTSGAKLKIPYDEFLFLFQDVSTKNVKIVKAFNMDSLTNVRNEKLLNKYETMKEKTKDSIKEVTKEEVTVYKKLLNSVKKLYGNSKKEISESLKDILKCATFQNFFGKPVENNKKIIAFRHRQLVSGSSLGLTTPSERASEYAKIGANLAMSNGFLGSVAYNTLQHSINVMKIVKEEFKQTINEMGLTLEEKKEILLQALMHDAVEATHIGDVPTPVKSHFPDIFDYEDKITEHLYADFGLKMPSEKVAEMIKYADKIERSTFIQLQFKNPKYFADAFNIYVADEIEAKLGKPLTGEEMKDLWREIVEDYRNYSYGFWGGRRFKNPHSLDFFRKFGLNHRDGKKLTLTREEYEKYGLDMRIGKNPEETLKEFAIILQDLGINVSEHNILDKYKRNNLDNLELSKLDVASTARYQLEEASYYIDYIADKRIAAAQNEVNREGVKYGL